MASNFNQPLQVRAVAGWLLVTAIALIVLGSLARLPQHWRLQRKLVGKNVAKRGVLGADEIQNFIGRAGHVNLRTKLARDADRKRTSGIAAVWNFAYSGAEVMNEDARVYVNVRQSSVYFFTTFFFYPARVEMDSGGKPINSVESLGQDIRLLPPQRLGELYERGYSHVITARSGNQVVLMDLRPTLEGARP